VHDRLVLDEARLGQRRNVDDASVEPGRQVLGAGSRAWLLLLRHAGAAAGGSAEHGRGVEGGELRRTIADEIVDELLRARL
jgi:hypothetical protein